MNSGRNTFQVGDIVHRTQFFNQRWSQYVRDVNRRIGDAMTVTGVGGDYGEYIELNGSPVQFFYQNYSLIKKAAENTDLLLSVKPEVDYITKVIVVGEEQLFVRKTRSEQTGDKTELREFYGREAAITYHQRITFHTGEQVILPA